MQDKENGRRPPCARERKGVTHTLPDLDGLLLLYLITSHQEKRRFIMLEEAYCI